MPAPPTIIARARCDANDWLITAEEPLAAQQRRAGGDIPGIIAAPALRGLVRRARLHRLRLAEAVRIQDGDHAVTAWVEVCPADDGETCDLAIHSWRSLFAPLADQAMDGAGRVALIRHLAELSVRLGPGQHILAVDHRAQDLDALAARMADAAGRLWTEFVDIGRLAADAGPLSGPVSGPVPWPVLDGARVRLEGSERDWAIHCVPLGQPQPASAGFDLYFVADTPLPTGEAEDAEAAEDNHSGFGTMMGREIAPVLRQPISRIIANAETIRTRLAGPLADEYSAYASDIASAGQHLLALIDDLADLEVVEEDGFTTAPDRIDLADLCRRAAGILGVRARERGIAIAAPGLDEAVPAIGEFRRVLQVLLNLVGNAIRYSPEGSQVWLRVERHGDRARIVVADEGDGLSAQQQARLFEKFERLGREEDGGTGLGLYISRRLARAMNGDLTVDSAPGQGARFILDLPADLTG